MIIHTGINEIKQYSNPVVAMGNFDGVHQGHQKLITALVARAHDTQGTSIIITYWPHSKVYFGAMQESDLLQTLEERLESFKSLAVDVVIVFPFTKAFSETEAKDFIETVLVKQIGITEIIVGYDSVFGKDKKGNKALLEEYGTKYGFAVSEITPLYDEHNEIVSSTRIRNHL